MKTHWILTLCLSWLLAFAMSNGVLAQNKQELTQPKVPLEQMLNRDGTLDLNKGFHGSLDPTGWQMTTGPNGEPRFVPAGAAQQTGGATQIMTVPGDENWDDRFGAPGTNSTVYSIAVSGSEVYAGGWFTTAGGVAANYFAKWNGTSWSASGSGMNSGVSAIAVSGGEVYAGGNFTTAGGVAANYIAKWDGTSWSALGSGMNSVVYAIAVSGSEVYAGGYFTTAGGVAANFIAKWNGASWSALGSGMLNYYNYPVSAITVSGSEVYAGGEFDITVAGRVVPWWIAKWNGTSWSAVGSGTNNHVYALAASGSEVYAGGQFTNAGGAEADYIAKLNGTNWFGLHSPNQNGVWNVSAIAASDGEVYVGGGFETAAGVVTNYIAKWNGTSWSGLGSGMNGGIYAIAVSGSEVYAGGVFTAAGGVPANYIAKWNGTSWSALGSGMNRYVYAIAVSGSEVYAGGVFTAAGGAPANYMAEWNGTSWSALGSGMNGQVKAIAVSGSEVYAGGYFTTAGGVTANCIAKWNGTSWSALGSGMNNNDVVYTIAVSGSEVYAGGYFKTAGGVEANGIAKWNGTSWSTLGSGMNGIVGAIAVRGNEVYMGGYFTTAGGIPANNIVQWNGTNWLSLGGGTNNVIWAVCVSGSNLYVGGNFTMAGGKPSSCFGRYSLNQPPLANAGSDQTLIVNGIVHLDGSSSSDPDGDPITYSWEITSKPAGSNATLSNSSIVNPTFVADKAGEYRASLVVNDGIVNSTSDEVIITAITAQDAVHNLVDQVLALNEPQGSGLIGKLQVVIARLDNNKIDKAIEMLQQFIDQVNVFIGNGTLTAAEGQPLIDAANAIIAALRASGALPKNTSLDFPDRIGNTPPAEYRLEQNSPNPFNPTTTIQFSVPRESFVRLKVYNAFGAEVATLVNQQVAAGTYKVNWDASRLASGFYLYRLEAEGLAQTKKLLLMK
jgi:K319L-like, PKD domain/Secretion system C-terminal sorting domain